MPPDDSAFLAALRDIPAGYSEGRFEGRRWGVTLQASEDGRRRWLFGEVLGGADHVSFNLYALAGGMALRPCEMSTEKVVAFVQGYVADASPRQSRGSAPSAPSTGSADGSGT